MSHSPYDSWIFDENNLSNQQKKELYEHIQQCSKCSALQNSWGEFHNAVVNLPEVSPAEGFTQRWRKTIRLKKEMHSRRQVKQFFVWLFVACGLSLSGSLIYLFSTQSFLEWILVSLTGGIRMLLQSGKIIQALITWFGVIPPVFSVSLAMLFIGIFGLLSLVWFYLFIVHVYRSGDKSYEKIR